MELIINHKDQAKLFNMVCRDMVPTMEMSVIDVMNEVMKRLSDKFPNLIFERITPDFLPPKFKVTGSNADLIHFKLRWF